MEEDRKFTYRPCMAAGQVGWQAPPKGLHKDVIVCENLKLTFPSVNIYFLNFPELNIILAHQIQLFSWLYSGIRRQLSALLWLIQPYLWSNFTAK